MLNAVIAFSLRHRALVLGCTLALLAGGVFAFSRLPIDAVPDITNNQVQILTKAPSLSALEIERFVTFPIELSVKSLPDLVEMRSLSRPGLSVITVVFEEDVDVYFGRQLILEKLREIGEDLPEGVETPELGPVSTGLGEIFRYVVRDTGGRYSPMELRTIQDWIVRRDLLGTEALAEVNSLGGEMKQYQVLVDPQRLAGYGLSLRDVFRAAAEASDNAGGAYLETGPEHLSIRAVGLAAGEGDIRDAVIRTTSQGIPITIGDVAEVKTGAAIRFGSASQDGRGEVVVGIVMQLKDANARVTVSGVKERIERIGSELPEGVVIEPFYDRGTLVSRTIRTVVTNLVEGALLVIGVLLLLLASIRAGLIVASVIPLAMCFAGIMMFLSGQTGNLMSLGAIDFGLVVDGSLIIVENILRMLERRREREGMTSLTDSAMRDLVYDGAVEVRKAAQFGEIIIIIVYLPIIALQGIEGKLFRPMALTVGFALVGALILSVTYVPAISSMLLRGQKKFRHSPVIEWLRRWYRPALDWALHRRTFVMTGALAVVAASVIGFNTLGGEFIPRLDEGDIAMHLIRLPSVSLTESQKMATTVEKELMTFPEVRTVVSHTGRAEISTDPMGFELADVFIMLRPRDEWPTGRTKEELIRAMSERLEKFQGFGTQFQQPIEMRTNELIAGARGDVVVKVYGEDYDVLTPAARKIAAIMRQVPGAADVTFEQTSGLPQLVIRPDRDAIARYGMTMQEVNHIVETAVAGTKAGTIYEGERSFDLVVRFKPAVRENAEAIRKMLVATPTGTQVPLSELASISVEEGPVQISREEGSRFTIVQANVRGRDVESFVGELNERIGQEIELPPGYRIDYGGQFENLREASTRLTVVVPIALFLILALLYQTFGSLRLGLLIFLCIPMAVVGGVAALMLRGMPFSISAGVGFIALFGVAVLNGIVMVAAIRKHQSEGRSRRDAIRIAADERLRPVITTAALAGFGFLPMMLATSAGAEVQRPLATVIIGGLISATLLTLFVLPAIYDRFGGDPEPDTTVERSRWKPGGTLAAILIGAALLAIGGATANGQTLLTREAFIERVRAASPELKRAEAEIERVDAEGRTTNLLPPTETFFDVEEYPTGNRPGEPTMSIGIGQSFDFPTLYSRRSDARRASVALAEEELEMQRLEVTSRASRAWIDLVRAHRLLRLSDTITAQARRIFGIARLRRDAGDIDLLETSRAGIALAEAQRDSILAVGRFRAAVQTARSLMNTEPTEEFTIPDDELVTVGREGRGVLVERLRSDNPALQAALLRVRAAHAGHSVIAAERIPRLGLEFSYQSVEGVSGYYGGQVRLQWPISRWFGDPKAEAARTLETAQEYEAQRIERELIARLDLLLAERDRADALLDHYRTQLLPAARDAWHAAVRLYQEGESGYTDVLATHNEAIRIEHEFIRTLLESIEVETEIGLMTGGADR